MSDGKAYIIIEYLSEMEVNRNSLRKSSRVKNNLSKIDCLIITLTAMIFRELVRERERDIGKGRRCRVKGRKQSQ